MAHEEANSPASKKRMVAKDEKAIEVHMKVNVNGVEVEAAQTTFEVISEPWTQYRLPDGRVARIKVVGTKVFKTEALTPQGIPIYSFESQNIIAVDEKPPESAVVVPTVN